MKKKIKFKAIISGILIVAMCFCLAPTTAFAAKPSKSDKGIKAISKAADMYLLVRWLYNEDNTKPTTLKMDAFHRADMLSLIYNHVYNPVSKTWLGKYGYRENISLQLAGVYYKNLFGKDIKKGICDGINFEFSKNKFHIDTYDLNGAYLSYKIKNIKSLGKGKYNIKTTYYYNVYDDDYDVATKMKVGTSNITITKSKKSSYRYVITKIQFENDVELGF